MNEQETYRRLRWRCRRGLLELDTILLDFLEQHYAALTLAEREAFARLLESSDQQLWEWFAGHTEPADSEINQLLKKVV